MPSVLILYQYFYPDDVVSAMLLAELAEGLAQRGWKVTAMPSNRSCRDVRKKYQAKERHNAVSIERVWRPPFRQASAAGRIINSAWIIASWSLRALAHKPDAVIIGTDPVLSVLTAVPWKALRPSSSIIHWCFDLYPEAAVADGLLKPGFLLSVLKRVVQVAYRQVDIIADIGSCMRKLLAAYLSPARFATLPPWALTEPSAPLPIHQEERRAIFGDSKLAVMYSGSFGRAHSCAELLALAREMRDADARFAFSIRGNCEADVRNAVSDQDRNIAFVPFASQQALEARLSAADILVVSLRSEWTGTVVPSKFFGALAAGRPVLYIGNEDSYPARIIREHSVGWVCSPGRETSVALELRRYAGNPSLLGDLNERCHRVYQTCFAKELIIDRFDSELRVLTGASVDNTLQKQASHA